MPGPKEKKERSLGVHLGLKAHRCNSPKCVSVRRPYRPGAHGQSRRRRTLSDFGRQIQEKQKFKLTYGLDERGLRMVFDRASKKTGSLASKLIEILESRLDNAVYRLALADSRSIARQFVLQGHITVNGKRVRSPGFQVSINDVIGIHATSASKKMFKELKDSLQKQEVPDWLHIDKDKMEGKILRLPHDVESPFEVSLLVESFSK